MKSPLSKILDLASEAFTASEACVLCSVVRLEGSGYGRVGAKLLVTESGEREGYISGGCLERDLCKRALHEARTNPKLMTFDTRGNTVTPSRYNTGCEGVVYVLCQPLTTESCVYRAATAVAEQRRAARMLTVYRSDRRDVSAGTAIAQFDDGTTVESAGPKLELTTLQSLVHVLRNQTAAFTATVTDAQQRSLELVVETLQPSRRLVIFGAGDDAMPVVRLATGMDWEVCVVGKHPDLANSHRFPGAQVFVGDYATLACTLVADEFTHVISMTHDFDSDLRLLPCLLQTKLRSIGLLGSKRRLAKLLAELYYRGERLTGEQIERIRSPLGLDIGAETPEDIALSITAELLAIESGRSGLRLSDKTTSNHTPIPHYQMSLEDISFASGSTQPSLLKCTPLQATSTIERR